MKKLHCDICDKVSANGRTFTLVVEDGDRVKCVFGTINTSNSCQKYACPECQNTITLETFLSQIPYLKGDLTK